MIELAVMLFDRMVTGTLYTKKLSMILTEHSTNDIFMFIALFLLTTGN
jgi:hypothetical protein